MTLNKIFSSHMVFARRLPIRIYGEGSGVVQINFVGYKKILISEDDKWIVEFPPMEYGGPYSMEVIFEDEKIVLEDIYIGEVFLFAGQSNMQFKMKESNTPIDLYNSNNKLRLYSTDRIEKSDYYTSDDGWVICEKEQVGNWSAIAYLTGNEISKTKNIAVGAIACYQGASVIESWVPKGAFKEINIPEDKKYIDHTVKDFSAWNSEGTLYSYALSQVVPFSVSAVVWYQGESDATQEEGLVYCDELSVLINVWRKDFYNPNLPFVIVQISDNIQRAAIDNGWSLIQKAQIDIQSKSPNVKTVISADVCENNDIHPKTKDKLAQRISNVILNDINL